MILPALRSLLEKVQSDPARYRSIASVVLEHRDDLPGLAAKMKENPEKFAEVIETALYGAQAPGQSAPDPEVIRRANRQTLLRHILRGTVSFLAKRRA